MCAHARYGYTKDRATLRRLLDDPTLGGGIVLQIIRVAIYDSRDGIDWVSYRPEVTAIQINFLPTAGGSSYRPGTRHGSDYGRTIRDPLANRSDSARGTCTGDA